MILNCTLEELNAFMKETFTEKALKIARLHINIQIHDVRQLAKTYPPDLLSKDYVAYDAAIENMASGKVAAIKAVRAATNCDLKEGKDFVERWFPNVPVNVPVQVKP